MGALSHPVVSSTCGLAVKLAKTIVETPVTCSLPSKESHSRSRRSAAEARASTSKPWISLSGCVEPAYQAKNSYWTVHASYETSIPTRIFYGIREGCACAPPRNL